MRRRNDIMNYIYLDSNILIAYYSRVDSEAIKKSMVTDALEVFSKVKEVQLCTSDWSIAEMVNVLISNHKMESSEVAEIESNLFNSGRIASLKIKFIEVSPDKNYDFKEFFYSVRQGILKYHSGVGDIIHSVVMKNNNVVKILTFDDKDDFKKIPDLIVLHPKIINVKKK